MRSTGRLAVLLGFTLCAVSPLAAQRPMDPARPLISPPKSPERSVVCGMTIVPGNPALDAKMAKTPPPGDFTLQVRTPQVCRDMSRLPALRDSRDLPDRLPTFLGPRR